MKIGCSLPFKLFTCPAEDAACLALLKSGGGDVDNLLAGIRRAGAQSVEFRSVGINANPAGFTEAYKRCITAELSVTVHGSMPHDDQSKADFFAPYQGLFQEVGKSPVTITLHALAQPAETAETLDFIADCANKNGYPVLIVLENSRNKLPGDAANSCEGVCEILDLAANKELGICWDFGHYYFNLTHFTADPGSIPPAEFLAKVCHTHIHAVYNEKTHFPLGVGELPLRSYCDALTASGYRGLFNLELGFSRFYKELDPYKQLIDSINILKESVSHE